MRILLWLLPVADVFYLKRILNFYQRCGVEIPLKHAKIGLLERWIGYLPVGFVGGCFLGLKALLIYLVILFPAGLLEFYLMSRGTRPWSFFKAKARGTVAKIFLLEAYNASSYFMLGVGLGMLL